MLVLVVGLLPRIQIDFSVLWVFYRVFFYGPRWCWVGVLLCRAEFRVLYSASFKFHGFCNGFEGFGF